MSGREGGLLLLSVSSHAPHLQAERPHRHTGAYASSYMSSCVGPNALSHFLALAFWLQPDVSPENCWPLQGHEGQVVIRLPARVHLTAITVQHISKEASPSGTVISAPRDIAVFVSLLGASGWPVALGESHERDLLAFVHPLRFVSGSLLSTAVP